MKTNWLFRLFLASLCLLTWGVTGSAVYADGDETLGAPTIAIADGSALLAAGVGLVSQPGTINLDVPAGATVQQALLYWQGRDNASAPAPTDTILVNGGPVTGDLIGSSDLSGLLLGSIPLDPWGSISYRADITDMIGTGANALTIDGLTFATRNDGASVVVIVDDGTSASIEVRDGNDFVSWDLRSENGVVTNYDPFGAAVVQTFSFAPAGSERTADLLVIAGDAVEPRRDEIEIIVNGTTLNLTDVFISGDGSQWDTLSIPVTIPAGATSISVELISPDPVGDNPDSLSWVTAGLTVPIPICGDGAVDPGEDCDDGNDIECDGCFNCEPEFCGDGKLCGDETCDPTAPDAPANCRADCTYCGDGIVNGGEACDPQDPNGPPCRDDCTPIECGDGIQDPGEQCDDGNDIECDGCFNCALEFCGDGKVCPGETCDPADITGPGNCRDDCTFCGDGIVNGDEDCDPQDPVTGADCRDDCTVIVCGDGILDPGEVCDDGNDIECDGCFDCQPEGCGDGKLCGDETCDPTAPDAPANCRDDCTYCGDGFLDPGEECDDGNNLDGDGCSATCEEEGEGCLTLTPGFWGNRPAITAQFLPVESCGLTVDNVLVTTPVSALEDMCKNNKDAKANDTSSQQLSLIRACTAAALNIAASSAGGGDCESDYPGLTELMTECCAEICTSGIPGQDISETHCIEDVDEFNNSDDTLEPFGPFIDKGGAEPDACSEANGNGFVNPGRNLGAPKR